ncbi:hypothetical protein [Ammoniphilus resinae]|uniref:Uncharacterized protein n=1 Tax=Ammoniphilus resinae TaxID=861532 RepID=A0ABS4GVR5_9BACL|nr:hypothetical protein [Ammoniphilus resinae]MBP1933970.1 hypothetical protein [Ammoniphilus resinae]
MSSSKTKNLVGGKTLSLWIPDDDWVDDFNHLLAKRSKQDRSITRNSLFLECVEKGLSNLGEQVDQTDSLRIYLDTFPPEQAELLRTPAGKQLVVNLLSAIISGQLSQLGSLIQPSNPLAQTGQDVPLNQDGAINQDTHPDHNGTVSQGGDLDQGIHGVHGNHGDLGIQATHDTQPGAVDHGVIGHQGVQAIPGAHGNQVSQNHYAGPINQIGQRIPYQPEPVRPRSQPQLERRPSSPASAYVAAAKEPAPEEPPKQERKIPDLFHTLMRNTKINN